METISKKDWQDRLGRIAVLCGGQSAEREISLQSGAAIISALSAEGLDVIEVDIRENPLNQILAAKPDRVFNALHGPGGEDGKIQALLEFLQIPYTGSGVAASALSMDKLRTKQIWRGVDLPTARYSVLTPDTDWAKVMADLGGVAMVKPCHEGSSIGMSRVESAQALEQAFHRAFELDSTVIAEAFISGAEYTVAILEDEALPPIMLKTENAFYDYDAKYQTPGTQYICPCGLPEAKVEMLKKLALDAFYAVGAKHWGRVDVMADNEGRFYLLELNSVPGMTNHSLVPMAAKAAGLSFNELVVKIVTATLDK